MAPLALPGYAYGTVRPQKVNYYKKKNIHKKNKTKKKKDGRHKALRFQHEYQLAKQTSNASQISAHGQCSWHQVDFLLSYLRATCDFPNLCHFHETTNTKYTVFALCACLMSILHRAEMWAAFFEQPPKKGPNIITYDGKRDKTLRPLSHHLRAGSQ